MERLFKLYRLAEKKQIEVITREIKTVPAFSVLDQGRLFIVVDPSQLFNTAEEIVAMAHELGHCMTGSVSNGKTPLPPGLQRRYEFAAEKWAITNIVTPNKLAEAIKYGCREPYEFAEHMNVTERFVREAMTYYKERIRINTEKGTVHFERCG